jgi:hypothetical protein
VFNSILPADISYGTVYLNGMINYWPILKIFFISYMSYLMDWSTKFKIYSSHVPARF